MIPIKEPSVSPTLMQQCLDAGDLAATLWQHYCNVHSLLCTRVINKMDIPVNNDAYYFEHN